jgi:transcription elongation GreA/GreB family factor
MSQDNPVLVALGTHVEVELIDETGTRERLAFDLVPDEQADFANGFLGEGTPLAQTIWSAGAGEVVPYRLGDVVSVRVVTVTPAARVQEEDIAAKRQAVIQRAIAESERISDMVFALAVGSKWGDYDPGDTNKSL